MHLTYSQAVEALSRGRNGQKKLENNTYLRRVDENTLAVRLHNTDIVLIHEDGTYTLHDGGYRTVTTKARINEHSPVRIHSKNGIWYVGSAVYHDGMRIDASSKPIGATADVGATEKAKKALDRKVRKYVKAYAQHMADNGGLVDPGHGDCFGCQFTSDSSDQPMGVDHILSHMEEGYYVPSLLWKAINAKRPGSPSFCWQMVNADVQRGNTSWLESYLSSYLRTLKPALLEAEQRSATVRLNVEMGLDPETPNGIASDLQEEMGLKV